MSFPNWSKVAMLALLPLAAHAQQAGPADPDVPVSAPEYISVFKNYRSPTAEQGTPDEAWRAANQTVANQDPHAGHLAMPDAAPRPAAPAAVPVAAPAPADPHAGHGGHHH